MAENEKPKRKREDIITGRWVLFATILASSMAFIDGTALNIALPALQEDLGATGADLLWILNAYALLLAALILVGGSLGDHFGRKKMFMIGIGIFAGASLACGLAPTTGFLIGARAIQGIGGALMVPGSLAIISAYFDSEHRGQAIGTWSAFSTITTVVGPILGGFLASAGLWRGVFFINIPIAIIAFIVLYLYVPESRDEGAPGQLDYPGAVLITLSLAGITYGFVELGRISDLADTGIPLMIPLSIIVGVIALIAFIFVEGRSDHAMMPLHLFKSHTFSGTNIMTLFLYGALSGVLFFLPLNLIQVQGYDEAVAGFTFLPFTILLFLLSRWAGGLVDRYGPRLPLVVGSSIVGIGFYVLAQIGLTGGPDDYWTTFLIPILIIGLGMSIIVAPLTTAVMGSAAQHYAGTASGVNNAVSRSAGVLAIAIMGAMALLFFSQALVTHTESLRLPQKTTAALQAEAGKFGDAAVPDGLAAETADAVQMGIRLAFVDTFKLMSLIGAGMCFLSAILAAIFVESRLQPQEV